jgi:hypothetical protein
MRLAVRPFWASVLSKDIQARERIMTSICTSLFVANTHDLGSTMKQVCFINKLMELLKEKVLVEECSYSDQSLLRGGRQDGGLVGQKAQLSA